MAPAQDDRLRCQLQFDCIDQVLLEKDSDPNINSIPGLWEGKLPKEFSLAADPLPAAKGGAMRKEEPEKMLSLNRGAS